MNYRAEIDGLRAIAVVSVILYHAKIVIFGRDWFEGGFIGVDIFFVISGYLITRIILTELEQTNTFSFIKFYERRARRILPMLFVVIFVSVPYAWQKLLPSDFVEYAESIFASLFFGSNFFFYFSTTEYGADSALLKPFLHTWSLSVEEQFYLVFPILAIVAFKYFRKHFLTILIGLSLLSLQFAELMEVRNADLNFYLPFTRFWELAVGSLLAYRELYYKPSNEGVAPKSLPMIGLYLIAYSILFFDSKTPHPSFVTLIPVVGVALIIGFGSKEDLVTKMLSIKPIVGIGLISYSLYLWHFPVMAFARIENNSPTTYDKMEWIILTVALSVVSFFIVERPFRKQAIIGSRLFIWVVSIVASLLLIILTALSANILLQTKSNKVAGVFYFDQEPWLSLKTNGGSVCYQVYDEFCKFNVDAKTSVFLIGDSTTAAFQTALQGQLHNSEFSLVVMTSGACPFLIGVDKINSKNSFDDRCRSSYQEHRLETILNDPKDKVVILGGALPLYFNLSYFNNPNVESTARNYNNFFDVTGFSNKTNISDLYQIKNRELYKDAVTDAYVKAVRLLLENDVKVILVRPFPEPGFWVPKYLKSKFDLSNDVDFRTLNITSSKTSYNIKHYRQRNAFVDGIVGDLKHENLTVLDFSEYFCDRTHCFTHNQDGLLFIDEIHQSERVSKQIAKRIFEHMKALK